MAFGIGVWLAGHLHRSPWLWGMASALLIVCALAAVAVSSVRLGYLSVVSALICAGACSRVWMPVPQLGFPPDISLSGAQIEIIGHVTNDGALLAGSEPRERFDLETEIIQVGETKFTQPVGVRATVFVKQSSKSAGENPPNNDDDDDGDDADAGIGFPQLAYGDRVKLTAKLRLPRNFRNPEAFDYEGYLHALGITTLASVRADRVEVLPGNSGTLLGSWRSRIRRSILQHLHNPNLWSENDAALFAAMVVGDDSLLLRHVREEFQQTGVYHLLVVSGMNVGLLAFAVFWLARRLRAPQWAASAVTIALSVFYAFVAGMGAPIMRAVLMLSLFLIARLFYRDRAALNATGFAALVVLVISPTAWFDPAFQLTFLALLAISGVSLPILERTSARYRRALLHLDSTNYDLSLDSRLAQFRLDLRLISGRVARFVGKLPARLLIIGSLRSALVVGELLVVSSITQAVLVLPMRMYFHRAAIVGLPANLVVLPLAGVLLNGAVAAIALSYVWLPLARVAAWLATTALHWTLFLITSMSRWNLSQWRTPDATITVSILAGLGIVAAFAAVRGRRLVALAGVAALFLSAAVAALYRPAARIEPGKLEVTAIGVGQGDSVLLVSPEGKTMLIDGGGAIGPFRGEFDYGEDVVSPYLWWRGIDRLDAVVLTHAHDDHIGGLPRVVENFHPRELWLGINPETAALRRLRRAAFAGHVKVQQHVAGDSFDWGGTRIRVLSPPGNWQTQAKPKNDDSLAFLITYGHTRALLAGDMERRIESFISAGWIDADLLKVPHHGSNTSTTAELLQATHPRFAVISVGAHNSFGHPRREVLERLQERHVLTYRTDTMGAITFLLDGSKVEAKK
ncbi:MAG TPA: ComEC/Rec2 family competence protein [Candidatus Angelobacter sp.]|nr:ComEC/Rec2 family competence protein [Candidatus Angelobacter sp.]